MQRAGFYCLVLIGALCTPVLALPGQTTAQFAAWGKANAALRGFHASIDDETGGTNYMATVVEQGYHGEYNAEPQRGRVHMEYISFQDMPDAWHLEFHLPFVIATIRDVYGEAIAADFTRARRIPHVGRVAAWQGKKLAYATFGTALFIVDTPEFANLVENMHVCDAIVCDDDD